MCLMSIKEVLSNPKFMSKLFLNGEFNHEVPEEYVVEQEANIDKASEQAVTNVIKKITKSIREKLKKAFPQEALRKIEFDNLTTGTSINPAYILERLNDCFGVGNWNFKHQVIESTDREVTILGTLFIPEYNIVISQYGGMKSDFNTSRADVYKGAVTNALSKCSSYLEIGIDVYKGLQTYDSTKFPLEIKPENDDGKLTQNDHYQGKKIFEVLSSQEVKEEKSDGFLIKEVLPETTSPVEIKDKKLFISECKACNNLLELEKLKKRYEEELKLTEYQDIYCKFETSILITNSFKYCNTIQEWQKIHKSYPEYHDNDFYKKVSKRRYAQLKNNQPPKNLPKFDENQEMKELLEEDLKQEVDKEYITA